jgi:hypothetical protein
METKTKELNEEEIDNVFRSLVENMSDDDFWKYVRTWKDEQNIINDMKEWDTETKAEAIKEIKKLMNGDISVEISKETMEDFERWKKENLDESEREEVDIEEFARRNLDALGYLS